MLNIYQQIKNAIASILKEFKDFVIRLNPEKLHSNLDAIDGASQNIHTNTTSIDKNLSQMLENNSSYQKDILTSMESIFGAIEATDRRNVSAITFAGQNIAAPLSTLLGLQRDLKNSLQSINDTLTLILERLPE